MALHSVVLPMPLRPTTARMPRSRVTDTSCTAWACPSWTLSRSIRRSGPDPTSTRRRENELIAGLAHVDGRRPRRRFRSCCGVPCFSTSTVMHDGDLVDDRKAISRSCSMMMKSMCSGSARSSATSSRRSAGERPAAGSSNRIRRGAPASAMPISSCRCWPCDRLDTSRRATDCRRTRSSSSSVAIARGMRRARRRKSKSAARHAAHGEEKIVPDASDCGTASDD